MEIQLNPAEIGKEMESGIDFILEGEWSEGKQEAAIAFEEAFVNVCNYAYQGMEKSYILAIIQKEPSSIEMDFWDEGVYYDPTAVPLKEIEEGQIGGHGIRLMRSYCEMTYRRVDGKNHLHLTKQL